jgi:hypothetical protein
MIPIDHHGHLVVVFFAPANTIVVPMIMTGTVVSMMVMEQRYTTPHLCLYSYIAPLNKSNALVGMGGFEPPTSGPQNRRSTKLSYTPSCLN